MLISSFVLDRNTFFPITVKVVFGVLHLSGMQILIGGGTILGVNIVLFITCFYCLPIPTRFCGLPVGFLLLLLPFGHRQLAPAGDGDGEGDGDGDGDGPPILYYGDEDDAHCYDHTTISNNLEQVTTTYKIFNFKQLILNSNRASSNTWKMMLIGGQRARRTQYESSTRATHFFVVSDKHSLKTLSLFGSLPTQIIPRK